MSENYDLDEEIDERPFDRKLFKRMMGYLVPFKMRIAAIGLVVVIGLASSLMDPYLISVIVDKGIGKHDPGVINRIGLLLMFLYAINFISGVVRTRLMNRTAQGVLYNLRREVFEHMQTLSFRFFDGRPAGKIMSRVTNDVQTIADTINGGLITIISETLSIVAILCIIFAMSFKLAIIAASVIPMLVLMVTKLKPMIEARWSKCKRTTAAINANLNETILGIRVIQAFSRERDNASRFHGLNKANLDAAMRAIKLDLFMWPLVEVSGMIGTAMVIWYGTTLVMRNEISPGFIIAFVNYLWRFWGPVSAISRIYSQILSAMASADRIFQVLDTEPEVKDDEGAEDLERVEGRITFEGVSFGYNPRERMVLHDISLDAEPGQVIALVGPTGAGKSSIINLLMRFYDPSEGRILIDGRDIRHVTGKSLRSQVGLVLQESFLFSGSIEDNILFGRPGATHEEVLEVARVLRVMEFAEKFPNGLGTEIEERGAKLSAGQKQLVSFARALLADPRILVLDEATASVDTRTERVIQEALNRLLAGRTAVIIAHRLSTIEHADKILVLDEGRVVESGNHRELLLKDGLYSKLYHKQFELREDIIAV